MQKGFTLIELIVIIVIFIILSSVTLASLSTAREKSRAECRKDHSTEYCAEKAGITEDEFEKLQKTDNKEPCNK